MAAMVNFTLMVKEICCWGMVTLTICWLMSTAMMSVGQVVVLAEGASMLVPVVVLVVGVSMLVPVVGRASFLLMGLALMPRARVWLI
jgi:hypothetical protein